MLLELFVLVVYFLAWMAGNVGAWTALPLRLLGVPWWTAVLVQAAAFGLPIFAVTLPFRYLGGYLLPRHFGLLVQSRRAWAGDFAKGVLLSAVIGLPLILGLYGLLRYAPDAWWAWAALGYTLYGIALTAILPVLLIPLFYRVRPLGPEHEDLALRLAELALAARTRIRGVSSLELSGRTPAATALLVGLGRTRRVLLTDTLLNAFTHDEIETVFAHEVAHQKHWDIPVGIGVSAGMSLISLRLADFAYRAFVGGWKLTGLDDPEALAVLLPVVALAFTLLSPVSNAYSRWREARADRFALQLTQKPEAFASAMRRLASLNLAVANPSRLSSGTSSHPPLVSRIRMAEEFARRREAEGAGSRA
jgi:STE24 endopeptidase